MENNGRFKIIKITEVLTNEIFYEGYLYKLQNNEILNKLGVINNIRWNRKLYKNRFRVEVIGRKKGK